MSANPLKGETDFAVGAKTYVLALQANELAALEKLENVGLHEVSDWFNDRTKLRVSHMRSMLWAAMQRHHPEMSLFDVGDIMSEAGIGPTIEKLGAALQASFPEAQAENPLQGQA